MGGTLLSFVVHVAFAVSGLWVAAGAACLAARRASAALRHRVWALASVGSLLLPLAVWLLPERRVGPIQLPAPPAPVVSIASTPSAKATRVEPSHEVVVHGPRSVPRAVTAATIVGADFNRGDAAKVPPAFSPRPIDWRRLIVLGWLLPALWLGGRLVVSLVTIARRVGRSRPLDGTPAAARLEHLVAGLGVRRAPSLRELDGLVSPLCVGVILPAVLLPAEWRTWPADRLDAVLTHELAHVARRDVAWQLVARVACAAYWPHPLAWVAAWRMRVERELACDDWVLRRGQSPTRYAHWLLDVAAALAGGREPAGAVAMAARRNGLERRIVALLDGERRRVLLSRRATVALTVGATGLLAIVGVLSPLAPSRASAAPATAPVATATTTQPASNLAQVSGVVEDAAGQLVAGATVELYRPDANRPNATTRSGADGHFRFEVDPAELRYGTLLARAAGDDRSAMHRLGRDGGSSPKTEGLRLLLKPARQLDVTIRDRAGQAVGGAWVAVHGRGMPTVEATSDDAGRATLRAPADALLEFIVAEKAKVGFDYRLFAGPFSPDGGSDPARLAADFAGKLEIRLGEVLSVTVEVVDTKGQPVSGAWVYPWLYTRPDHGGQLNLAYEARHFSRTTGADGTVQFDDLPADNTSPINIWAQRPDYRAPDRCFYDPATRAPTTQAVLVPLVHVSGDVTDAAGRPVGGAKVFASGQSYHFDAFGTSVTTGADGSFAMDVQPDMFYLFVADKEEGHLASAGVYVPVRDGTPAQPIHLKLGPATRVFGRVTAGPKHQPLPKASVIFQQWDDVYDRLPADQKWLAKVPGGRNVIDPKVGGEKPTDADGRFEFYAGPGRYSLFARNAAENERQEVVEVRGGEGQIERNLDLADAGTFQRTTLNGRVVLASDPRQGVEGGRVEADDVGLVALGLQARTDAHGGFTLDRPADELRVHAMTPDGKLAGIASVGGSDGEVTIAVAPVARMTGRLVDARTGAPLAGWTVWYGVHVGLPGNGPFSVSFGGRPRTGPDGRFVLEGLVPGTKYEVRLEPDAEPGGGWEWDQRTRHVTAAQAGPSDLGDLKVDKLKRPANAGKVSP